MDDKERLLLLLLRANEKSGTVMSKLIKHMADLFWDCVCVGGSSIDALANIVKRGMVDDASYQEMVRGMSDGNVLMLHEMLGQKMPVKLRTRKFRQRIEKAAEVTLLGIKVYAGSLMHRISSHIKKEDIYEMVMHLPEALSYERDYMYRVVYLDEDGLTTDEKSFSMLPIQSAVITYGYNSETGEFHCKNLAAVPYIPFLAQEGLKHNVGGDGMRGGLLCKDFDGYNVLERLATPRRRISQYRSNLIIDKEFDLVCLDALTKLRESGLFKKEDIQEYGLLEKTFERSTSIREETFRYLVDLDPTSLKQRCAGEGMKNRIWLQRYAFGGSTTPFFDSHSVRVEIFQNVFKAALKHYPHEIGLLFEKDDEGKSLFTEAIQYLSGRFSDGDGNNDARHIIQACLEEVESKEFVALDTRTNMYPFMTAAAVSDCSCTRSCSLNIVYGLIRRDPSVIKHNL